MRRSPRFPTRACAVALLLLPCAAALAQADVPTAAEPASRPKPVGHLPSVPAPAAEAAAPARDEVSLDEIRRFVAVFRAVKQAYVDPVDDATLMRAAIRGLLTDLDPHSAYLDADQSMALTEAATGAYDGLGVEVVQQPDRSLLVIAPIDDTPAARAGIQPGDLIVAVDGQPIGAENVDQAVESMRGEPGTTIELTIVRDSEPQPLTVSLVRETIHVASVRLQTLEPGYAYLRISHFQADTGAEVARKLGELAAGKPPLKGLVLDLRSNPGGLLHSAVEAADVFLEPGVVVATRGRMPFSVSEQRASRGDILDGAPIIVLIDGGTASAAEVLAAALRDHDRALLMGSRSFGKGSVQTVLPLDNGDAVKLTTARYYTPDGVSIQASGIAPDIALPEGAVLQVTDRAPSVREADLPGHLRSDLVDQVASADPASPAMAAAAAGTDTDDYAVRQALTVLKGLTLFGKPTRAAGSTAQSANGDGP